jgi:hypothetical protein
MAREVFKDRNPVGQRIQLGSGLGAEYADTTRVIVGVMGDVRETSLERPSGFTVFIPRAQVPDSLTPTINRLLQMSWAIRTKIPPAQLAHAVRGAILSVNPQLPPADMQTMDHAISTALDRQRFTLLLMLIFASLAVVIAGSGVFSVVGYHMRQRERELGIRLALGATPDLLVRPVTRHELRPISVGVAAGVFAALALARFIRSLLFETSPYDPLILTANVLIVTVIAWFGCYVPARRASLVAPMIVLRGE